MPGRLKALNEVTAGRRSSAVPLCTIAPVRPYAHPIGVSLGDMVPPERIGERARHLEQLGYSHLMIPEDYWYEPALVCVTLALGATESVPIGTSIVSGLVRHPAV